MKNRISKILIVEDDYKIASEWQRELNEIGFLADIAANTYEAEFLLDKKYDCFIIDLFHVKDGVFLKDGGIHLISKIRKIEADMGLKSLIITVTGYYREKGNLTVSTSDISKILGADIAFAKPIDFSTILKTIEEYNNISPINN